MKKIIVRDRTLISPFNEPARDLRVMNKPLWLYQRDVLSPYCREELECDSFRQIAPAFSTEILSGEFIVYRDNLFFDEFLFEAFITKARELGRAAQIAFAKDDAAIITHALPLQDSIHLEGNVYVADLFYYPDGTAIATENPQPIVIDTQPKWRGYYRVPTYMANDQGDLGFQVPLRSFLSIENWVHVFTANCPFGVFARGARIEKSLDNFLTRLKVLWRSLLERKQFLSSSALVLVGKNSHIDPTAIIQGPTIIGDNVSIGPGCVIDASIIGNNVNIMQGVQILLSVIGDGSYMAFRSALFMTTLMEKSMVAQNTCLQLSVVGRDTFIGAGNTFTDYNLLTPKRSINETDDPSSNSQQAGKIKVFHKGKLQEVGMSVLGGCVGHNCRIGSGHVIYPARSIESDVVLAAKQGRTVIAKNIRFEDSDHHAYPETDYIAQYRDHLPKESDAISVTELVKSIT